MKIKSLTLKNYKRFLDKQTIVFNAGKAANANSLTLFIGENGSGKTSILQAITVLLTAATRPKMRVDKLEWEGYAYDFLQNGTAALQVEVSVEFSKEEVYAAEQYQLELNQIKRNKNKIKPIRREEFFDLSLNYEQQQVEVSPSDCFNPFEGYKHALALKNFKPNYLDLLERVGSVYWYTEQRSAHSIKNIDYNLKNIDALRAILVQMFYFHLHRLQQGQPLRAGQRDVFEALNNLYQSVFPDRQLKGAEPNRNDMNKTDFWFSENGKDYELSGLSAGERAVLPILLDFALMNINHSVIIIDEIELHLNPKLLQNLIKTLKNLGHGNHFILTSHSPYVMREIAREDIKIIRDGRVFSVDSFTKGRNAATIMEELFDLPERTDEANQKISAFYQKISAAAVEDAANLLDEITEMYGSLDTEVVRARFYYEDLLMDLQHEVHS